MGRILIFESHTKARCEGSQGKISYHQSERASYAIYLKVSAKPNASSDPFQRNETQLDEKVSLLWDFVPTLQTADHRLVFPDPEDTVFDGGKACVATHTGGGRVKRGRRQRQAGASRP